MKTVMVRMKDESLSVIRLLLREQAAAECKKAASYNDICAISRTLDVLAETYNTTEYKDVKK